jgi:hypothetical protein
MAVVGGKKLAKACLNFEKPLRRCLKASLEFKN